MNTPKTRARLYQIMLSRNKNYDGKFYCGVHTTGIYCRPICPARPLLKNVSFYKTANEAEALGFRPCLRCRPDLSPRSPQWNGTASIVGRALKLISVTPQPNLTLLSDRLGITDRHLRRLFGEHLGQSPKDVILSRRLTHARHLLKNPEMTITEIAHASGFGSLRRFNDAFLKKFKSSPSEFRKRSSHALV